MKKPHIGIRKRPLFFLIYGTSGTRKSTFCANLPDPVFIDVEGGLDSIDVASYDHHREDNTYDKLVETLDMLLADSQGYKTVVIDSLDWVQHLVEKKICDDNNVSEITELKWGNGTKILKTLSFDILDRLLSMFQQGLNVAVICHCDERMAKAPDGKAYPQYDLLVHKKVSDTYRQRADMVLFAARKVIETEDNGVKSNVMGKRPVLFTESSAGFFAKNRYDLPSEIPMDYSVLIGHIRKFYESKEKQPVKQVESSESVNLKKDTK